MKGVQAFFRSFYGDSFHRHFRRPPDYQHEYFKIQFTVKSAKDLYYHMHRNSGYHPCFTHVYDYGSHDNLKRKQLNTMVFDRAFFDFDVNHKEIKKIKDDLLKLRCHGLQYENEKQEELRERLVKIIIEKEAAFKAVNEAKNFAENFKENSGKEPLLFFSGCKGCHAYAFFKPTKFKNINLAMTWFAEHIKNTYQYQTMDLSVTRDAMARLSRIPYSKHQLTGLSVVPFNTDDEYRDIMIKSMNPYVEEFDRHDFVTDFNQHLFQIDEIENHNAKVKESLKKRERLLKGHQSLNSMMDHRKFFKSILGEPVKEYDGYFMYNCPLPDHEDMKPSFLVNERGYYCFSCQRKGNYWQFLKDFHGWSDEEVKDYLKNSRR